MAHCSLSAAAASPLVAEGEKNNEKLKIRQRY
jgi:hypothetical protein